MTPTISKEFITTDANDRDAWTCICGNTPISDGFFPCDVNGNEMEPTIGSGWHNLYVCFGCGRIIDQETLEVVGRNLKPKTVGGDFLGLAVKN